MKPLQEALSDEDEGVRAYAKWALEQFETAEMLERIGNSNSRRAPSMSWNFSPTG